MKICKICGVEKPLNYFHKNKTYKDGHDGRCKECSSRIKREYYVNNKEYINARNKKYYDENLEEMRKRARENSKTPYRKKQLIDYAKSHKEEAKERARQWRIKNSERVKIINKKWRENNPDIVKENIRNQRAIRKKWNIPKPINDCFPNSNFHHLHTNGNNSIGIYIPTDIHNSIRHRHSDSNTMYKINRAAFEWYWKELIIGDIQWL